MEPVTTSLEPKMLNHAQICTKPSGSDPPTDNLHYSLRAFEPTIRTRQYLEKKFHDFEKNFQILRAFPDFAPKPGFRRLFRRALEGRLHLFGVGLSPFGAGLSLFGVGLLAPPLFGAGLPLFGVGLVTPPHG